MKPSEKLKTCRACPHGVRFMATTFCGTPVVGERLELEGLGTVELCGCAMRLKLKLLPETACPVGRFKQQ